MKYVPILFSTPMVIAINNGSKTQTRRTVKYSKKIDNPKIGFSSFTGKREFEVRGVHENGQYGSSLFNMKIDKGDILWVRETHYAYGWWIHNGNKKTFKDFSFDHEGYRYIDNHPLQIESGRKDKKIGWFKRPSIFMPKDACRIFLKVTNVRVERLNEISEEDAVQEGILNYYSDICKSRKYKDYVTKPIGYGNVEHDYPELDNSIESFFSLWESINGKESLEANPFVWVYDFEKIEKPSDFSQTD